MISVLSSTKKDIFNLFFKRFISVLSLIIISSFLYINYLKVENSDSEKFIEKSYNLFDNGVCEFKSCELIEGENTSDDKYMLSTTLEGFETVILSYEDESLSIAKENGDLAPLDSNFSKNNSTDFLIYSLIFILVVYLFRLSFNEARDIFSKIDDGVSPVFFIIKEKFHYYLKFVLFLFSVFSIEYQSYLYTKGLEFDINYSFYTDYYFIMIISMISFVVIFISIVDFFVEKEIENRKIELINNKKENIKNGNIIKFFDPENLSFNIENNKEYTDLIKFEYIDYDFYKLLLKLNDIVLIDVKTLEPTYNIYKGYNYLKNVLEDMEKYFNKKTNSYCEIEYKELCFYVYNIWGLKKLIKVDFIEEYKYEKKFKE